MVMTLSGWLDTVTAGELKQELDALDGSVTALTLDLRALEYISSAGLRQLVAAHKLMQGNLTLRGVPPQIMDLLRMAGFDKRLNIVE